MQNDPSAIAKVLEVISEESNFQCQVMREILSSPESFSEKKKQLAELKIKTKEMITQRVSDLQAEFVSEERAEEDPMSLLQLILETISKKYPENTDFSIRIKTIRHQSLEMITLIKENLAGELSVLKI